VALVIVEATSIHRFGDELVPDTLQPLVNAIHAGGALAAIQLFPARRGQSISPVGVSDNDLAAMIEGYRLASVLCREAGFDGVEPHGAHGYLLNQFFSPIQNTRTDSYGGSLDNRMRLALRITEVVREAVGDDRLLLYRHTPIGQGYGIDDSLALAEELVKRGVDVLDISPASDLEPGDRAAPFTDLGKPIIAVNELDIVERALEVLAEGRADLVAVGRGLIADPDWPAKVREGRHDDIVRCVRCDLRCHGNLREGIPIGCSQWKPTEDLST
jgi:2,4-dienoyl-CoA reductase-like NADH-dependent reductase (Old Yellow Enzyme family)